MKEYGKLLKSHPVMTIRIDAEHVGKSVMFFLSDHKGWVKIRWHEEDDNFLLYASSPLQSLLTIIVNSKQINLLLDDVAVKQTDFL